MTTDGRPIETEVVTKPYPGSDLDAARSKAEPGGPATGIQPIHSDSDSTSSAAGSRP